MTTPVALNMDDIEMPDHRSPEECIADNVLGNSFMGTRSKDEAPRESIFEDEMEKHMITVEDFRSRLFDDNRGDPIVVEDHDEETLAERNINAFHSYVNIERLASGAGLPLSKQLFVATWKKDNAEGSRLTRAILSHYEGRKAFETCINAALVDCARIGGFSTEDLKKSFLNEAEQMARNCAYIRAAEEMEKRALEDSVPPPLQLPAVVDLPSDGTNKPLTREPITRAETDDFGTRASRSRAEWAWAEKSNGDQHREHEMMSLTPESRPTTGAPMRERSSGSRSLPPQRTTIDLTADTEDEGVTVARLLKAKKAIKDARTRTRASKIVKTNTDHDSIAAQAGWVKVYVAKRNGRGGANGRLRYKNPFTKRLHKGKVMERKVTSKQNNDLQPGTVQKRHYNLRSKSRSVAGPEAEPIGQTMGSVIFDPDASPTAGSVTAQTAEWTTPEVLEDVEIQSTRDNDLTIVDRGGVTPEAPNAVPSIVLKLMIQSRSDEHFACSSADAAQECELEATADGDEVSANHIIRQTSTETTPQVAPNERGRDMLEFVPGKQGVPIFSLNKAHQGYEHFKQAEAGQAVDWHREPCQKGKYEIWVNHTVQQTSKGEPLAVEKAKMDEVQLFYQDYQHFDRARDGAPSDWQHEPRPKYGNPKWTNHVIQQTSKRQPFPVRKAYRDLIKALPQLSMGADMSGDATDEETESEAGIHKPQDVV